MLMSVIRNETPWSMDYLWSLGKERANQSGQFNYTAVIHCPEVKTGFDVANSKKEDGKDVLELIRFYYNLHSFKNQAIDLVWAIVPCRPTTKAINQYASYLHTGNIEIYFRELEYHATKDEKVYETTNIHMFEGCQLSWIAPSMESICVFAFSWQKLTLTTNQHDDFGEKGDNKKTGTTVYVHDVGTGNGKLS